MMSKSALTGLTIWLIVLVRIYGLNHFGLLPFKTCQVILPAVRHVRPEVLTYVLYAQRMFSVVDGAEVPVDPGTLLRTKFDAVLRNSAGVLLAIAGTSIMRTLAASAVDGGGVTQTTALGATTPAPAQDPVVDLGPLPSDYGLVENDYYGDAAKVRNSSTGRLRATAY